MKVHFRHLPALIIIMASWFNASPLQAQIFWGYGEATIPVINTYILIDYSGGGGGKSPRPGKLINLSDGSPTENGGGELDTSELVATYYAKPRFGESQLVVPPRILASLRTNAAGVKLSFQQSASNTVKASYETSLAFDGFGIKLSSEYERTKSLTLTGEFTAPTNDYWVFNVEEDLINDYYDIMKVVFDGTNQIESIACPKVIAQKQNSMSYIVYKNGSRL